MDLSNRQSAEYWHKRAEEVTDPDLRKEALDACRDFRKMAKREERQRMRQQKPGYGVRSMIGYIVFVFLIVLAVVLGLAKVFSAGAVIGAFAVAVGVYITAAAISLRVHGHISEDGMLAMIQKGLRAALPERGSSAPAIEANTEGESSSSQHHLPPGAPSISFDDEKPNG